MSQAEHHHDSEVNEGNRRAYARIARAYAGDSPGEDDPELRESCRNLFVARLPGRRVLEVGCGPGVDAEKLRVLGLDVTATDFVPAFVDVVRERFPLVRAEVMDLTRPHQKPGSFDGIYAFACLVHLPRAAVPGALAALRTLLAPRGVFFLTLIRSSKLRDYVIEDWGGVASNPVLFTCWDVDDAERALLDAGFAWVERFQVRSPLYENLPRLIERGVEGYQLIAHAPNEL